MVCSTSYKGIVKKGEEEEGKEEGVADVEELTSCEGEEAVTESEVVRGFNAKAKARYLCRLCTWGRWGRWGHGGEHSQPRDVIRSSFTIRYLSYKSHKHAAKAGDRPVISPLGSAQPLHNQTGFHLYRFHCMILHELFIFHPCVIKRVPSWR